MIERGGRRAQRGSFLLSPLSFLWYITNPFTDT